MSKACKWVPHLQELPERLQVIARGVEDRIQASAPYELRGSNMLSAAVSWAVYGLHQTLAEPREFLDDASIGCGQPA
jgi:hypothetical protein